MPSVPIPIREVKEPVDSERPYLKPSIKEEGKKRKVRKHESRKVRKSQSAERRYTKRRVIKALHRTRFLVVRVPNIIKILLKKNFKERRDF